MIKYIINIPNSVSEDIQDVKKFVSQQNAEILLRSEFPGNLEFLSTKELIGDPNYAFSCGIADVLSSLGILKKKPVMNENNKQIEVKDSKGKKSLLWEYFWDTANFASCTPEQLLEVGWDLRTHTAFVHVHATKEELPLLQVEEPKNNSLPVIKEDIDLYDWPNEVADPIFDLSITNNNISKFVVAPYYGKFKKTKELVWVDPYADSNLT